MCELSYSYVWNASFTMSDNARWLMIHVNEAFVLTLSLFIHVCETPHSYVWISSFIRVNCLVHMCEMPHPHVSSIIMYYRSSWHVSFMWDLFICVKCLILIYVTHVTDHSFIQSRHTRECIWNTHEYEIHINMKYTWMRCVTMNDEIHMNESYSSHGVGRSFIHLCDDEIHMNVYELSHLFTCVYEWSHPYVYYRVWWHISIMWNSVSHTWMNDLPTHRDWNMTQQCV